MTGVASYFHFFELDAIWFRDLFELWKNFDEPLPHEAFRTFQNVLKISDNFFFYFWEDPKTLRNRKVRTRENRGMTVVPCVANRKRWLHSDKQRTVLLPYVRV